MSESPKTMFVVMLRNGTYDETRSKPIHTCRDGRDAERMASNKNRAAAVLHGKIDARDLMLAYWNDTHAHHVDPQVRDREYAAERLRLTNILGIQSDCVDLGFADEFAMDSPYWSVVEVPHGAD